MWKVKQQYPITLSARRRERKLTGFLHLKIEQGQEEESEGALGSEGERADDHAEHDDTTRKDRTPRQRERSIPTCARATRGGGAHRSRRHRHVHRPRREERRASVGREDLTPGN